MNAEKELLLALLIEKYTKPQNQMIDVVLVPKSRKRRSRRPNINTHHWTIEEKNTVWRYRKQGYSFDKIAVVLGHNLRPKQVSSMYANLCKQQKQEI